MTVEKTKAVLTKEQVRDRLKKADINGDGSLDTEELRNIFQELGSSWPGIRTWHCMRKTDGNGDGKISSSEIGQLASYIMNWYDAPK